ncbi:cache domain-containing protein [Cryobacterium sp. PH31-O1]|uniref:PDC sensor domain-containing protein n=1 Tax=Cryobacterium sp. PH31-O1 TaxID=3046306 RepID=UPI0024BBC6F0|nr:cache domain-containing protein [Cryobacterium sp. PH31-O1]MDJ0337184.1 cache domain-containing protein [Cryobacterium sp. PH31-O1]
MTIAPGHTTPPTDASVASVTDASVASVADVFDPVFSRLERWVDLVESYAARSGTIADRAQFDFLVEKLVRAEFDDSNGCVIGAGFVSAPHFLGWHLAWWLGGRNAASQGQPATGIRHLETVEDPLEESFRDYTALEWWRVPAQTGRRHITGPYVDYLCTDEYTLTLTLPVYRDGSELIGVVGIDLSVDEIERDLVPRLNAGAVAATVINASGRVVVSADAHLATGALLRLPGLTELLSDRTLSITALGPDGAHSFQWCGRTGLAVVAGPLPS